MTIKRIAAIDVGSVRIGVAVSDPLGSFAQGVAVLSAAGSWIDELADIVREYCAEVILIGMPVRTDGTDGPEADEMRRTAERLAKRFGDLEIVPWDERFTTTMANQALLEADVSRKGRRGQVDKVAAALLLQSYLDFNRKDKPTPPLPDIPIKERARAGRTERRKRAYD